MSLKNAKNIDEQREQWIPRDKLSNFSGEITITAYVKTTSQDWNDIKQNYEDSTNLNCRIENFPQDFTVRLVHKYTNGDFKTSKLNFDLPDFQVKTKRAKNFRKSRLQELKQFRILIYQTLPTVAYYPTFIFDFPKRIYLTDRDKSPRNRFYRQLFQDILDYDGRGYTIEDSILARLHKEETKNLWENWFSAFVGTTEEDKVRQVIAHAEIAVTNLVFTKWNEVFGEKVDKEKRIVIDLQYEKGQIVKHEDGTEEETN